MGKQLPLLLALVLLVGCSSPGPQPSAGVPTGSSPRIDAGQAPSLRDWQTPPEGSAVAWKSLPDEVRQAFSTNGDKSPDGRWIAARITPWNQMMQLWIATTDETTARLIQRDQTPYSGGLWGPAGTYLYRRNSDDSWQEVDPSSGAVKPFLPDLLKGQQAGNLLFSPDGKRLLYRTGLCYCNRPTTEPLTTFVVNIDGTNRQQVGTDVDARWEGDQVVTTPPGMYPLDVTSGAPPVDRVIRAYLKPGDTVVIGDLATLTRTACTTQTVGMPGEPPCEENEADGTQVEVFPLATCEPNYIRSLNLAREIIFRTMSRRVYVYAAYRFDQPMGLSHKVYGIVFASSLTDEQAVTVYLDQDGAVVEVWQGCGPAAPIIPSKGVTFLLPPKK